MTNFLFFVSNPANASLAKDSIGTVLNVADTVLENFPPDTLNRTQTDDSLKLDMPVPLDETDMQEKKTDADEESDSLVIKRGVKKKKKEKPDTLVSYFFEDTLRYNRYISWTVNRYLNSPAIVQYTDTLQDYNLHELAVYKTDVGFSSTGVTGGAILLHNFFKRQQSDIFPVMSPYNTYHFTPDNLRFFNVKGPVSDLSWHTSGQRQNAEDNVKVMFTRNISPSWNAGLYYHKLGSLGVYQNQRAKAKTFNIFTSYIGQKYVAHAGYIYNSVNNRENGGIVNDFFVVDTVVKANTIDVKLKTALNEMSSDTYFLTHSYGIPLNIIDLFRRDTLTRNDRNDTLNVDRHDTLNLDIGTIVYFGHSFEYSRYARIYTDGIADTGYVDLYKERRHHYYDNYYYYPVASRDSLFASRLDNRLFIRLQPYSATAIISKIDGGLGYVFDRYYGFHPSSYLYKATDAKLSSGYLYGNAQGVFSKYFSWQAFLKYHFSGYRINDLLFDATARLSLYPLKKGVHFQGRFMLDNREQPHYMKKYYSNHFKWDNSLNKTTETRIEASIDVPDWHIDAGFKNTLISNYVYFNDQSIPTQTAEILNVTALHLNSNLRWRLLRLDSRLLFQTTSNSAILPLPMFSGNLRPYIDMVWVKKVLNAQIGLDIYYNTLFYDYAYNPATGMFHTQSEKKLGNYLLADAFASFRWKQANIYVKYTNVAEGIVGRHYFSALHYPRTPRMLRYGLRWFLGN
ncbi:MAG: putative porin [Prevotellaceae bacterium]|jgi:hypothetical protein|nr:putative porin [Prevotellaceae bacterium]